MEETSDFAEQWQLEKRIFVPRVAQEQLAWLDCDVGTSIHHIRLAEDWKLPVVGSNGLELWDLKSLSLETSESWRNSPSRRIFATSRRPGIILLAAEDECEIENGVVSLIPAHDTVPFSSRLSQLAPAN